MLRFTGVLVLLALLSQGANGQIDNGHKMTEQVMKYLKRIILHQEQQQLVQDERMERLEQMVNETANQLQQQQIENKRIMVAMSQKLTENEERSAELIRGQHVQDERMERQEQMLNETVESQRRLEMQVGQLQQQQVEHQVTILAMSQKLTENEERSAELIRGQRVQDERMERLEQMLNETVEGQRGLEMQVGQLQQQQVEHQVTINQTCATTAEQSLQLLNNALSDISAQLVTIHDIQYGVRLVGCGSTPCREGRLEVWAYGSWGTVCDDYFGTSDAQVACYSLGFGRVGRRIGNRYGDGSGPILLDDLQCSGSESSLFGCRHMGVGRHNCLHNEDISISCY